MQNKPYGTKSSDSQEGNQDGDSPSSSQESGMSSATHSVSKNLHAADIVFFFFSLKFK